MLFHPKAPENLNIAVAPEAPAQVLAASQPTATQPTVKPVEAQPVKEPEPTPPAPQPAPVARTTVPMPVGCDNYRPIVAQYAWNVEVAMNVMRAESGCNPSATNTTDIHRNAKGLVICKGSYGLFQISCHGGVIYDPEKNIAAAWSKYQASGWKPWGVCTSGKVACF